MLGKLRSRKSTPMNTLVLVRWASNPRNNLRSRFRIRLQIKLVQVTAKKTSSMRHKSILKKRVSRKKHVKVPIKDAP